MSTVQLKLGALAVRALSAAGEASPGRLSLLLSRAASFYLAERDDGRPGWAYPSFLAGEDGAGERRDVDLDEELWQQLCAEAERQQVAPEDLLQHAALYYGAVRDEGRLTERIAEELRREEEAEGAGPS